jgi:hypothetical protein
VIELKASSDAVSSIDMDQDQPIARVRSGHLTDFISARASAPNLSHGRREEITMKTARIINIMLGRSFAPWPYRPRRRNQPPGMN